MEHAYSTNKKDSPQRVRATARFTRLAKLPTQHLYVRPATEFYADTETSVFKRKSCDLVLLLLPRVCAQTKASYKIEISNCYPRKPNTVKPV
jgi:hypothetical protein